ncbi:hypothetical protein PMAYCL1PPCAC_32969, partial [Pristionchus mayeri]
INRKEYDRVNPDNVEFTALLALAFWDTQVAGASEELTETARRNRAAILKELRKVYVLRGNIECEIRQRELIGLLNHMKNHNCHVDRTITNYREPDGILRRIDIAYNASVERRRSKEWKLLESIDDRKIIQHPTETLYLADGNTPVQTFNICYAETRIFIHEAFPSLTRLSQQEQDAIFNGYIQMFNFIDFHYRTQQIWGDSEQYVMGSVLTVVDINDDDQWFSEDEGGDHRELMKESGRAYMVNHLAVITPIFKKAKISNTELYALLAFSLCEIDSAIDAEAISAFDELRSEVLLALQIYYKNEMGLDDFSWRLGNLMTINHCIRVIFCVFVRLNSLLLFRNVPRSLMHIFECTLLFSISMAPSRIYSCDVSMT